LARARGSGYDEKGFGWGDLRIQPVSSDIRFVDDPGAGGGALARVPRYCPRCERATGPEETLCPQCGETPRAQGYCPVCERFWTLPVRTPCPKHDLPLDDAPEPPAPDDLGATSARLVTLQTFADALAAEAPRLRLEAEGIPTFLEGERMGGRSMYLVATGGVKLQVPEPLAADARILLSQTWTPPAVDHDDLDDAWEDLSPEPGASRRSVMKGVILVLLFGPFVLWLIAALTGYGVRVAPRRPRRG
jgi:hypothetical protein